MTRHRAASRIEELAWIRANPALLDEAILNALDDDPDSRIHRSNSIVQGVVAGAPLGFLVDAYLNGDISIHVYFHSRREAVEPKRYHFAAVFEKSGRGIAYPDGSNPGRQIKICGAPARPRSDDVESSMSILPGPVVQDAECPVEIENHEIGCKGRSVVRLYRLDDPPTLVREWPNLPNRAWEIARSVADRKLKVLWIGGNRLPSLNDRGTIDAGVKSGAELVERLAEFECQCWRETLVSWLDPDASPPIVPYLHDNGVGFVLYKTAPELGESAVVRFSPGNTLPTALEFPKRQERA